MKMTQFKNSPWHWLILIVVLIISFVAAGYWYDQQQFRSVRTAEFQELTTVSLLKINQLSAWREEAIFNVEIYAQSSFSVDAMAKLLKQPSNNSLKRKILKDWDLIRTNDGFSNVILTGLDGSMKLSLNSDEMRLTPYEKELVDKTIETGEVVFSDLFRCQSSGAIRLDVMAPVVDSSKRPVAVLILRIDPERELYPLLDFWPTRSESSQTFIMRHQEDKLLLMNRLRTEPERKLIKILPLSPSIITSMGESLDSGAIFEGKDSRGVNVVAYIAQVPETEWIMVTQVDRSEVLADARYNAHFIALIVLLLILTAVFGSGFIYRYQRVKIYKKLYLSEKERNDLLEEFRITLYSIGDGVIAMDETGRIRHMNPVAERLTGWTQTEALGKLLPEVFNIIDEKTREKVENPGKRVLHKKDIVKLPPDTLLISRDGSEHPIADSAAPINKEKDKLTGIVVVFSDVTTERKAQRALQISEERYRQFFMEDITGDFISLPDGTLLDCNPAFVRMFDLKSKDEARKHNLTGKYLSPEARATFLKLLYKEKKIYNYEQELLRSDGKSITVIANVIGKFDSNDNLVQLQGYLFDISERKKLEKQFLQAQKMEAVGRLAGGIAHDFNNMLSVILGYCDLLLLKEARPMTPLYDKLMEIKKAAQRSADLTRQLLAFARKQIVEPKILDINNSIENMLEILRRLIGEDIDLVWKPGRNIWKVKIDPSQIDQILANLLVNARDAIDGTGKVTIEIENTTFDQTYCDNHLGFIPGEYVLISVSDDGCGMDEGTLANIFEPFFTTKEEGKGTGLGLATVYGIAKQNSGFVNVYSELSNGTKFSVYLPRFIDDKITTFQREQKSITIKGGKETILLVEDEMQILNMTRQMLENFGYTVLADDNPRSALEMVETYSGHIDLLITDVVLPEMTGRDLVKNILDIKPEIKCIYMSGYTANAIAHQGVLEEGINFLQKPFSRKQLASKVRDVLDFE